RQSGQCRRDSRENCATIWTLPGDTKRLPEAGPDRPALKLPVTIPCSFRGTHTATSPEHDRIKPARKSYDRLSGDLRVPDERAGLAACPRAASGVGLPFH